MTHPTLCIRGAEVLADANATTTPRRDIWIAGDRILALTEPAALLPAAWQNVPAIEAAHCLAIPGLVNAHCHSYAALLHGTVPGAPLDLFVLEAMARRAPRDARGHYVVAQLHALELLKHGITAHLDHVRDGPLPTVAALDATFRAYRDIGIRATVAPMYDDRVYPDSMPIDRAQLPPAVQQRWSTMAKPAPEGYFELMDALAGWRGRDGRLDLMLGVDGPQRCTPRLLEMAGAYAEKHAMGLHTHLLEAKTQLQMAPEDTGGSLVALLDRYGLVGPRSSFAHFVWGTERDMTLAAERGVNVVHNPHSNLHLGSGLMPTARLLSLGVNIGLGTDSASCGVPSLLDQARLMSLLSRVHGTGEATWVRERTAFHAATAGGARVLGLQGELGAIAPGFRADIALIDTRGLEWRPRGDVFSHLVMYETGANVRDVIVAGTPVLRAGRAVAINEDDLLAEAEALLRTEAPANAPFQAQAAAERPAFAALIEAALREPAAAERFVRLI